MQAQLSLTERAQAAAKTGLDDVTAQASGLRQSLSAEQKRAGALANEVKHAGKGFDLKSFCRSQIQPKFLFFLGLSRLVALGPMLCFKS